MLNIRIQELGRATIFHCVGGVTFPETEALHNNLALYELSQAGASVEAFQTNTGFTPASLNRAQV